MSHNTTTNFDTEKAIAETEEAIKELSKSLSPDGNTNTGNSPINVLETIIKNTNNPKIDLDGIMDLDI